MTDTPICSRKQTEFMQRLQLPAGVDSLLQAAPSCVFAESREQLNELALGGDGADRFEVAYEASGQGRIVEAEVVRCKNGLAVNYREAYMRRRDPADPSQSVLVRELNPNYFWSLIPAAIFLAGICAVVNILRSYRRATT